MYTKKQEQSPRICTASDSARLYKKAPSTSYERGDRVIIIDTKSRHLGKHATITAVRGNVILAVDDNEKAEHGYYEKDITKL